MARKGFLTVVVVLLLAGCGDSTLRERVAGLRTDVPNNWSVHRLGVYCHGRVGPGLLITNIGGRTVRHPQAPGQCTNAWNVSDLPDDFVLIDISRFDARPAFALPQHRTLPVLDSDLRGTVFPRLRAINFWNGQRQFTLRVWTGRSVSGGDRAKLAALISSIRAD